MSKPISIVELLQKVGPVRFRADGDRPEWKGLWKPSIHMPRWAARTFLRVESVKVERVQDISEEDAKAEGCTTYNEGRPCFPLVGAPFKGPDLFQFVHRASFWNVWNKCYPGSWERNDWVWAIQFSLIQNYKKEIQN